MAHAIAVNRLLGGDDRALELQVLRGLGDELQDALAARRFRVRTYLVGHPEVQTIAFTGSLPVGLQILRSAGELAPGQRHLKRVVAENTMRHGLAI